MIEALWDFDIYLTPGAAEVSTAGNVIHDWMRSYFIWTGIVHGKKFDYFQRRN